MFDAVRGRHDPDGEHIAFYAAGTHVAGQYHCAECGYGVTVHSTLPACPMCGCESWEEAPWSPLSRALELQ